MLEMINDRATGIAEGKNDLFSNLMASNASDDGPNAMSARELQGELSSDASRCFATKTFSMQETYSYFCLPVTR